MCICVHDENPCPEVGEKGQLKIEQRLDAIPTSGYAAILRNPNILGIILKKQKPPIKGAGKDEL